MLQGLYKLRKSLTWQVRNTLDKVWRSNLDNNLKIKLLRAVVELILLYGAKT